MVMVMGQKYQLRSYQLRISISRILLALLILEEIGFSNTADPEGTTTPAPAPLITSKTVPIHDDGNSLEPEARSGGDGSTAIEIERGGVSAFEFKVPFIEGVHTGCASTAQSYKDGTKCTDGSAPTKTLKEGASEFKEMLQEWSHPGNLELLNVTVKDTEEECSQACQPDLTCYYSMYHVDYICGSKKSKMFRSNQKILSRIQEKHKKYNEIPEGKICWSGREMGREYNPIEVDHRDIAAAAWFKDRNTFSAVEAKLADRCLDGKICSFSEEKKSFICGSETPKLAIPLIFCLLILLFCH